MPTMPKHILTRWLPLIAYCIFIYVQSSHPPQEELPSFRFMDKMLHVAAYAVLAILFYRAYQTLPIRHNLRLLLLLSILSASLYGISDEIHQYYVPFREADIFDGIADIIGAIIGVWVYQTWFVRRQATE
ncbi:MAG: VanZ family protein [Deltaproteobacteria bacterium]|jgi:VanZ family protein|nr:VanZ family protein [Deltaproteobacteria bacterium]